MGPSDLPLLFGRFRVAMVLVLLLLVISSSSRGAGGARAEDRNTAFSPCDDTTVLKGDGFTFGLLIGSNASFFLQNNRTTQVSPCSLHPKGNLFSTRLSVFRPKVDEISLLIVNYTQVNPENFGLGGYAVAYAGSQFAAVSVPQFLANSSYHITSLSLVLDFDTGRIKTPLWKSDGCKACQGNSSFVCVHGECAIPSKYCKGSGGMEDCSLSIQLTWSGTDQRYQVLNSWYQINNLGQYSLYSLYSNLMSSLSNQYNSYFH
ncbi:hypothetical protein BDL97_02G051400 [Sphagnum fallax]|jgi:hypothetical protein|nr:hypothetical protein BDL97_02G051400 [Sphagnum fallax]